MNKKLILLLIVTIGLQVGCSGPSAGENAAGSGDVAETYGVPEGLPTLAGPPADVTMPGSHDTQIVTSVDAYGTKTETRTFTGHASLESVVIRTLADGTRVGYALGLDGVRQPLADHHIAVAMVASADDIADMVGFRLNLEEPSSETVAAIDPVRLMAEPIVSAPAPAELQKPAASDAAPPKSDAVPTKNEVIQDDKALQAAEAERIRRLQREVAQLSLIRSGN